jgi:site-specific recombinase XerD
MTPIAPLITAFLREYMPIERGYSPHTCETYAHAFRLLFVFASGRLGRAPSQLCLEHLDASLVLEFLAHIEHQRGNDATTRNARLAAIKAFMRYIEFRVPSALEQVMQIRAIPTKRHEQALVRHLTMGEVRAILDAPDLTTRLGIRDRAMLHLCFACGLRVSELVRLPLAHVSLHPTQASLSTERAARSAASHFGNRQPPTCEPGWRCADLPASRKALLQTLPRSGGMGSGREG